MGMREKVIHCMKSSRLSQSELGRRSGIPQPTISDYLRGEIQEFVTSKSRAISVALGVSLEWLSDDGLPDNVIPSWAIRAGGPEPTDGPTKKGKKATDKTEGHPPTESQYRTPHTKPRGPKKSLMNALPEQK